MESKYSFTVSLRIWHPSTAPDLITQSLEIKPQIEWKSGDRRRTPKGIALKGFRNENYWCAQLIPRRGVDSPRSSLESALAILARRLKGQARFFRRLRSTGGEVELFVGWFGGKKFNFGCVLPAELLTSLGNSAIALHLDVYPKN